MIGLSTSKQFFVKLGISVRIPMAFKRFCDDSFHILIEGRPIKGILENYADLNEDEQRIYYTYFIQNKENKLLASFSPSLKCECFDEDFRPIFEKIVEDLHYAAAKANHAQDELHRRMTEQFERNLKEKSDKCGKFSL